MYPKARSGVAAVVCLSRGASSTATAKTLTDTGTSASPVTLRPSATGRNGALRSGQPQTLPSRGSWPYLKIKPMRMMHDRPGDTHYDRATSHNGPGAAAHAASVGRAGARAYRRRATDSSGQSEASFDLGEGWCDTV